MNRSVNQLSDIVDNGLCIGCGLCQSIAGKDKIEVSMTSKGRLEPKEISKITPEIFEKIRNVCPGTIVEGLPKENVERSVIHINIFFKSDQIKTETSMLLKINTPPIVGVPAFSIICRSGPSDLIGCPDGCKEVKNLIICSPKIREKNKAVKIAPPVLKVM